MLYCARISLGEKQVSALQIRTEERITYGRNDQVFCGEAESNSRSTVKGSGSKAASGVREGSDHTGSG